MSKSKALIKAIRSLPDGFYVHPISKFVNGNVRTTKHKTVVVPVGIPIEQLGSPYEDLRAVLNPENNKLIPLLLFIDPDIAGSFRQQRAENWPEEPTPLMIEALRTGSRKDWPSDELCRVRYAALRSAALAAASKENNHGDTP